MTVQGGHVTHQSLPTWAHGCGLGLSAATRQSPFVLATSPSQEVSS